MKKIYLIHGWGGDSRGGWFDSLREELSERKNLVIAFDIPNTQNPKIEEWVGFLQKNIKELDKNTFFIGHSIGCQTIMRYLETLPENTKVGGSIFVAGWFNLKEETWDEEYTKEIAKPWIEEKINFEKIKKHCKNFLAIFSDNDPYVPLSDIELFKKNLNARIMIEKNQGHIEKLNKRELKEILEFVK